MNLIQDKVANYIVTGTWSQKAFEEAQKYGKVTKFDSLDEINDQTENVAYTYYCDNETVHGLEFPEVPKTSTTLVCDMSSNLFSRRVDVSKFGMIYACAQKNFGASGLVLVIIRQDLIGKELKITPNCLSYKVMFENDSLYNTPHTSGILLCKLIMDWIDKKGGLEVIESENEKKSKMLYDYIERSMIYAAPVDVKRRSRMNVICKVKGSSDLEEEFVKKAESTGFVGIRGHRSVGGLRFSLYNALPLTSVEKLIDFMKDFEESHV
jgi:phosphoserine aminotransferase